MHSAAAIYSRTLSKVLGNLLLVGMWGCGICTASIFCLLSCQHLLKYSLRDICCGRMFKQHSWHKLFGICELRLAAYCQS